MLRISLKNFIKPGILMKLIGSILIIFLFISCGEEQEKVNPKEETITESVYASGIVKSSDQYQVFSPVNGIIQRIFVTEGDSIKQGGSILQVTNEMARLNIEGAQLGVESASINANRDKLNELQANINFLKTKMQNDSMLMERQRGLWNQQIGTRIELEQRELAYRNSIAGYDAAASRYRDLQRQINFASEQSRNNLKMSKTVAGDFTIKSNMNGKVYSLFKNEGEMVNTQTPIAVIGGDGEFILELQVDEYDIGKILPGQKVLITMDSYKNNVFEAEVTRVLPLMNERTRSFTIEAIFTKRPAALYPNLTTEANIVLQTRENAITIPRDFLVNDTMVILADGKKRKVVTGVMDFQKVEILSGLTTSDEIMKPVE
jgi:multidrug efflux pump subunit AcrA (membrane-fusion protein)